MKTSDTFTTFMKKRIFTLAKQKRFGTMRNYQRAYSSFNSFLKGKELKFRQLTPDLITLYESYLKERGIVRNSISFYMRILRAVYNRAVKEGVAKKMLNPFSFVYTGVDITKKRSAKGEFIEALYNIELEKGSNLDLTRDIFIFSYCARGMALIDVASLKKDNIKEGELEYIRNASSG